MTRLASNPPAQASRFTPGPSHPLSTAERPSVPALGVCKSWRASGHKKDIEEKRIG